MGHLEVFSRKDQPNVTRNIEFFRTLQGATQFHPVRFCGPLDSTDKQKIRRKGIKPGADKLKIEANKSDTLNYRLILATS